MPNYNFDRFLNLCQEIAAEAKEDIEFKDGIIYISSKFMIEKSASVSICFQAINTLSDELKNIFLNDKRAKQNLSRPTK